MENDVFALNGDSKVCKRVCDDDALSVLESILAALGGSSGVNIHEDNQTTTPVVLGDTLSLISTTVPVGKTWSINKVIVTSRVSGAYQIKVDGSVVGSGRTGASELNSNFVYSPGFSASAGQTVVVEYIQKFGPTGVDIEGYLMAIET
jgi:hypothetical protein